jgi:hypothetical protein
MFWKEFWVDELPSRSTKAWKGVVAVPGGSPALAPMPGLFAAPKPPPVVPPPKRDDPPVAAAGEPNAGLAPKSPPPAEPDPKEDVLVLVLAVLVAPNPPNPPLVPVLAEAPKRPPPVVPAAGEPNAGLLPKPLC